MEELSKPVQRLRAKWYFSTCNADKLFPCKNGPVRIPMCLDSRPAEESCEHQGHMEAKLEEEESLRYF